MASRQISVKDQEAVLKGFDRVLRDNGVHGGVTLRFDAGSGATAAAQQVCWKWVCRTENGKTVCGWEQVPC